MPEHLDRHLRVLERGIAQWDALAEPRRNAIAIGGVSREHGMADINSIWDSMTIALGALMSAYPEHTIDMLSRFADSDEPLVRFTAAINAAEAYFASPDEAHGLITRLLTDPDPRVVEHAHASLQYYANDADEYRAGDDRGVIPIEYLSTLPIESLGFAQLHGDPPVAVQVRERIGWWPH